MGGKENGTDKKDNRLENFEITHHIRIVLQINIYVILRTENARRSAQFAAIREKVYRAMPNRFNEARVLIYGVLYIVIYIQIAC